MRKAIALIGLLWIVVIVVLGGSSLNLEEKGQKIPVEAAAALPAVCDPVQIKII